MDILNHKLMRMKKFAAFFILALSLSLQSCEDFVNLFKDEWYIATDNIQDSGYWVNEDLSILLKFDGFSTSSTGGSLTIYDRGVFCLYGLVSLERLDPSTEGGLDAYHTFVNRPYSGGFMLHEARNNNEMVISYSFYTDKWAVQDGYANIEQSIPPTKFHRVDVEKSSITAKFYAHRGFKEVTPYEKEAHGFTADGASQLLIAIDDELQDVTNVIALVDDAVGKVEKSYFDETLKKWCIVYTAPSSYTGQNAHITVIASMKGEGKIKLFELPEIKIYKMGVGLIHGLISNAKDCFGGGKKGDGTGGLYGYLVDEVGYEDCQVKLIDYEVSNKSSFDYNTATGVVGSNLEDLYDNMLSQGIVSSKYALVGHSMGGILSRLWVQESENPELCGVGAIITLDTPHWGSQIADGVVGFLSWAMSSPGSFLLKEWLLRGPIAAIRDLASESGAMIDLNDENKMTKLCGIPVHAINSDMDGFETSGSDAEVPEKGYKVSSIQPSTLSNVKMLVFLEEEAEKLADLYENINDKVSIKALETVENVLDVIFADPHHDAVVSGVSQRGGLEAQYYTMLTAPYKGFLGLDSDAFHCNTNKWWRTYEMIADLLKSPYNDPRFCKTGFKAPENLKNVTRSEIVSEEDGYVFAEDESTYIDINSWGMDSVDVQDEKKQVLKVEVEGSENIVANMILVIFGEEDFNADLCRDTYYMEIPEDYAGDVQICVFGKNTENELVVDVVELVL